MKGTTRKLDSRQQAYLNAIGITTWVLRGTGTAATQRNCVVPLLKLGPGGGGALLICSEDTDSASPLASDINRSLSGVPVWAWPCENEGGLVTLSAAVEDHLFTCVAFFGTELAARFVGDNLPASIQTAKLVLLPAIQDLKRNPKARRRMWSVLCQSDIVASV